MIVLFVVLSWPQMKNVFLVLEVDTHVQQEELGRRKLGWLIQGVAVD